MLLFQRQLLSFPHILRHQSWKISANYCGSVMTELKSMNHCCPRTSPWCSLLGCSLLAENWRSKASTRIRRKKCRSQVPAKSLSSHAKSEKEDMFCHSNYLVNPSELFLEQYLCCRYSMNTKLLRYFLNKTPNKRTTRNKCPSAAQLCQSSPTRTSSTVLSALPLRPESRVVSR